MRKLGKAEKDLRCAALCTFSYGCFIQMLWWQVDEMVIQRLPSVERCGFKGFIAGL